MKELEFRLSEITFIKDALRVIDKDTFSKDEIMLLLLRRKTVLEDLIAMELQ